MLLHAFLLLFAQSTPSPAPPVIAPPLRAEPAATSARAGPKWFQGTFQEALAEAARTRKLVFVEFWSTSCAWCKKLEQETFPDPAVTAELSAFVCIAIDAESKDGIPIAQRYSVTSFPTLVVAEPDGALRERVLGFQAAATFPAELRRIQDGDGTLTELAERLNREPKNVFARGDYLQRLMQANDAAGVPREGGLLRDAIASGEGWSADSPYERWRVAQLLRQIGDIGGADAQIAAIGALGEKGITFLQRRAVLDAAVGAVNRAYMATQRIDPSPLRVYCAEEKDPDLLWDARVQQRNFETFRASREEQAGKTEEAKASRRAARATSREAWRTCTERFRSDFGRDLVVAYLRRADELSPDEKAFAVDVAQAVAEMAPTDPARQELLARALYAQGHVDRAITALQKALELAPERTSARTRLERYRAVPKKDG